MIHTVLFDLDGVLVEAQDWHYEALNMALREISNTEIARDEHLNEFNGSPTWKKLLMLCDMNRIKENDRELIEERKQLYTYQKIVESCKPDPVKVEMLEFLRGQGFMVGCVTNSKTVGANAMLRLAGLRELLAIVVSCEDAVAPKPHPSPYINAMQLLGVKKEQTLAIEDNVKGVDSALAAGCYVKKVVYDEVDIRNIEDAINYYNGIFLTTQKTVESCKKDHREQK